MFTKLKLFYLTKNIKYFKPIQILNNKFSTKLPKKNNFELKTSNNIDKTSNILNIINQNDKTLNILNEDFDKQFSTSGLRQFIKKTYLWTGGAIISSIGISILGLKIDFLSSLFDSFEIFIATGFGLSFGGIAGIYFIKPKFHENFIFNLKKDKVYSVLYTTNSIPRIISYSSLVSGMGILMIPMFIAFPDAIIPAFATSSSVFGGAVYYALTRKTEELSIWGPTLYSCLTGLAGVSLVGLGASLLIGKNLFGDITHLISLYGGIPLFTGLIAYDTYKAIDKYKQRDPDHLACSTDLYLNFINLFIRLIEIISKIQALANKDEDKDK